MTQSCCSCHQPSKPQFLSFGWIDYLKALLSWAMAFRRTFAIEPGLYYTGSVYERETPLLVTCNYHMTVFLLWRILKARNLRILVIDTLGINVWCSSGKGQFSAKEIIRQLHRYDRETLDASDKIQLVLPKLSLSGVSLAELRNNGIRPRIGPIYAADLPSYLDKQPLKNCADDTYRFNLKDRLFTLLPSLLQMSKYGLYTMIGLFVWNLFYPTGIYWQVLPITFLVVILYTLLFPLLPTKRFAIKGLALFALLAIPISACAFAVTPSLPVSLLSFAFYLVFTAGVTLFFSLSYTGNSGVSNYSLVKREVITFLPVNLVIFLTALVLIVLIGVSA